MSSWKWNLRGQSKSTISVFKEGDTAFAKISLYITINHYIYITIWQGELVPGAALFVRLLARTGCGGCLLASFANASTSLASNASPRPLPAHFATFWWAASRSSTCPSASCNSLLGSILLFHCFWQPFGQAALRSTLPIYWALFD